jgi:hypothetical protein
LKALPNLVFSPFQWTSAISPQLIRGRAIAIGARSETTYRFGDVVLVPLQEFLGR